MVCAFQTQTYLYLVMNFMQGGDLRYHLMLKNKFSQKTTKFFIACIIMALQHLQENQILHRDIKPENLVLDSKGYLRLTDFGIARKLRKDNGNETSGTPGYMAPEVLQHQNHSYMVDYFALGVLTYELMLGKRPYYGKNRSEIKDKILKNQFQLKIENLPIAWSENVVDFVNRLLDIDQFHRLGAMGINEIKNHPWFNEFNWTLLEKKELASPFFIDQNAKNFRLDENINDESINLQLNKDQLIILKNTNEEQFKNYDYQIRDLKFNPFMKKM